MSNALHSGKWQLFTKMQTKKLNDPSRAVLSRFTETFEYNTHNPHVLNIFIHLRQFD